MSEIIKPTIEFADFAKLDIRVGIIRDAKRHSDPKVTKLLILTVDVGEGQDRTICAGIAEHYQPEALNGGQFLFVVNLAPRTMRGIESNGMILAVYGANGESILVTPHTNFVEGKVVSPGSVVG